MKLLILGHGQHGKDAVAQIINDLTGASFCSSSVFTLEEVVWPHFQHMYNNKIACYEDRMYHRDKWYELIEKYNTPDRSKLATELLKKFDIYTGMRSDKEFEASKHLFDHILWVDRGISMPIDSSMRIQFDHYTMKLINNNGTIEQTTYRIESLLRES